MRGESGGRAEHVHAKTTSQTSRRLESFLEEEEKPLIAADQHNLADEMIFQIEASVRECV